MAGAVTRRKARDRSAERQKRCRARQRAGLVLVSFEVDEAHLTSVLLALGKLDVNKAEDRTALNKATRELVELLTAAAKCRELAQLMRQRLGPLHPRPDDRNRAQRAPSPSRRQAGLHPPTPKAVSDAFKRIAARLPPEPRKRL